MLSDIAIKAEGLSKCYHIYESQRDRLKQMLSMGRGRYSREFWALNDVSFEVTKGETVGIIGQNGCGKSTALQLICGTLNPTSGSVYTSGRIAALLELGAGFNPEFTGHENIYMNASVLGLSRKEIDDRYSKIIDFAGIGDFIDQPVKTYSSGMYVRLAFAIQANIEPDIFIVDEALAVGDAYFVHRCMQRFNELKKNGITILLVTHDANAIKTHCDRVIWLDGGSIKMIGPPSEVVDLYLANLFKRSIVEEHENRKFVGKASKGGRKGYEDVIPNIDRRLGDQSCSILGVSVYDADKSDRVYAVNTGSKIILSFSFLNNSLSAKALLLAGYVFRNYRGEELASTNTQMEHKNIDMCNVGEILNIDMKIDIPFIHPGAYSFSPTIGYINDAGEVVLSDRIENAVVVEVVTEKEIFTPMRMTTDITVSGPVMP